MTGSFLTGSLDYLRRPLARNVKPGDNVLVLTDTQHDPRVWQAVMSILSELGAEPTLAMFERRPADYYDPPKAAELVKAVPDEIVHRGKKLLGLDTAGERVVLAFEDGSKVDADIVIGADGVHSPIRKQLFGADELNFTGRIAYRTTFKASLLNGYEIDDCTKWWGPDRHIVIYYITRQRDEIYFVTSVPDQTWTRESWSLAGDMDELRAAFEGFHPQVRAVLEACPSSHKWPINTREPLATWSQGNVVLLGDACHPMTPYMAQGAATSMEDAAVLTRVLGAGGSVGDAFRRYEATRKPRTTLIQAGSSSNNWLHKTADTGWVYGYDAWTVPLEESLAA